MMHYRTQLAALCLWMALGGAATAASIPAELQGAWLEGSSSCEQVFVAGKKGMSFRKPVNIFLPAVIISGDRVTTPAAVCRIRSIAQAGNRKILTLACTTQISEVTVKAPVALIDGGLTRYTSESETDTGSRYERCNP